VVKGPVFKGPVVKGPVVKGPVVKGPVVKGPVVKGTTLVVNGTMLKALGPALAGRAGRQYWPRRRSGAR